MLKKTHWTHCSIWTARPMFLHGPHWPRVWEYQLSYPWQ